MGVAEGFRQRGIDLAGRPMNGTSAGSITAGALAAGLTFREVCDAWQASVDGMGGPLFARGDVLADRLFPAGQHYADDFDAMAVRVARWRREALSSSVHPVADIVNASCAVLPLVRPRRVAGHWYIDGGYISNSSIDLAPEADLLLAITPFRSQGMGMIGRMLTRRNRREIARWVDRHDGQVLEVEATQEIADGFSVNPADLLSLDVGERIYGLSVEYGRQVADEVARLYPRVVARLAA